jgi:TrmH family RNA methyltransferase
MEKLFINLIMKQNDQKRIRSLSQKKYREKYGQFQIEGLRLVESAVLSQSKNIELYWTKFFEDQHPTFVNTVMKKGVAVTRVTDNDIQSISHTQTPSGVVGVCKKPELSQPDLLSKNNWIYLDNISDPGNLGAIIRTAVWFNVNHIALSLGCVDAYNPKTVRSGMGAHFDINIYPSQNLKLFTAEGYKIIGADMSGNNVRTAKIPKPWILVLGGEAHGLQPEVISQCDQILSIPKLGNGESLNIASACSIIIYELSKS